MRKENENKITVVGVFAGDFELSHEHMGEKFYKNYISTERKSGTFDVLPVIISEKLISELEGVSGNRVWISGRIQTISIKDNGKSKLELFIFASAYGNGDEYEDSNDVYLTGFICKPPIFRTTPKGRDISDVIIAVNMNYGRTSYIPCVFWGRNAAWIYGFNVGTEIFLAGRLQSREYTKKHDDGTEEIKIAYEVSASSLSIVEEGEVNESI